MGKQGANISAFPGKQDVLKDEITKPSQDKNFNFHLYQGRSNLTLTLYLPHSHPILALRQNPSMSLSTAQPSTKRADSFTAPGQRTFGCWQLLDLLGEGRWSQVFRARPLRSLGDSAADYAIKILRPDGDSLGAVMMQHEVYVAYHVSHPNLCPILSAHVDAPPFYFVMPLLPGQTVKRLLNTKVSLPPSIALWTVRQVAEAMLELHNKRWIHGDTKPENIIVGPNGHATLTDLGFCRSFDRNHNLSQKQFCGTIAYAAPETLTTALNATPQSDIYSLGIVLFEMLTGESPFRNVPDHNLVVAHLQKKPSDVRSKNPFLSNRISELLTNMLAKDPLRRPTAEELVPWLMDLEIDLIDERTVA